MASLTPVLPGLWHFPDTCNVYILREGRRALLIDCGSGDVLRHLPEIGVDRVDWVLYTHHHREGCQGHPQLAGMGVRVGAPAAEADLFTDPAAFFGQFKRYCVEGAPYARPPREPIPIDAPLGDGEMFSWGPFRIACDHSPGHSPGMMVYRLEHSGKRIAFCGDLLRDDGRLDTFYDSEWDYGYGAGFQALLRSIRLLAESKPDLLLPAQGESPLEEGTARLNAMAARLAAFLPLYRRDWDMEENVFLSRRAGHPTEIAGVRRIEPHLFSLVGNTLGHNAYLLVSDSGRGLMIDAGIFHLAAERWLERKLSEMREAFGLKGLDAVLVTHYHGDHVLQVPYLRREHAVEVWTHEAVVEPLLHPDRHNLTCLHPHYGLAPDSIPIDRVLGEGERLRWEEFDLEALHLPGQTEFAAGYFGEIDGRRVGFSGDNLFASPGRSGHDAFIARNRGILEEGYLKCAEVLLRQNPDLLLGGHGQEIPDPRDQIERLRDWALRFRRMLAAMSPDPSYETFIDPYWIEVVPYKLGLNAGRRAKAELSVTNHSDRPARMEGAFHVPAGWRIEPESFGIELSPRERERLPVAVTCPVEAAIGIYPLAVDVTWNGRRMGEKFDSRLRVDPP